MNNHDEIRDNQIVDRYLMGKLSAHDAAAFEDHFMSCDDCMDELELAQAFQRDIKKVAVEEIQAQARVGLIAMMLRNRAAATAMVMVAVLAILFPFMSNARDQEMGLAAFATLENVRSDDNYSNLITLQGQVDALFLNQPVDASYERYRATLRNDAGKEIFKKEITGSREELMLTVPGKKLSDSRYTLVIEGALPAQDFELYSEYGFQIQR